MPQRILAIVFVGALAACAQSGTATVGVSSQTTAGSASASSSASASASASASTSGTADPVDLMATLEDLPAGFELGNEQAITIDSEVADYGTEGAQRRSDLEERGFLGGYRRTFSSGTGNISSIAMTFETPDGARAEYDENAALYATCGTTIDTGGTIGDVSAGYSCAPPPRPVSYLMIVQGSTLLVVRWSSDAEPTPADLATIVALGRTLAERAAG